MLLWGLSWGDSWGDSWGHLWGHSWAHSRVKFRFRLLCVSPKRYDTYKQGAGNKEGVTNLHGDQDNIFGVSKGNTTGDSKTHSSERTTAL